MIRPNDQSFIYTKAEKRDMLESIKLAKLTGLDGIVIGALTTSGEIDTAFMREVVALARPLEITFHRAFEEVNDLKKSAHEIASLGINYILTSGKEKNPLDAVSTLRELNNALKSTNTQLLVGGGVTPENIHLLREQTGLSSFHAGSAVRQNRSYAGKVLTDEINKMI
jgi:copper homeostasis protein